MTKYTGKNIVTVYAVKTATVPGGTMIASGGYVGVHRQPAELFYFDERVKIGGVTRVVQRRVTNVRKPGRYRKNTLKGL